LFLQKFDYHPLPRKTINGKRTYQTPTGDNLPSVTTILEQTKSEESRQALQNWRNRVGHRKAQEIVTEAAGRGTRMHTYLERYIKNGELGTAGSNPYAQQSHKMAQVIIREGLQHVDEIWGIEAPLYYDGLYAGTTDSVGVWQGAPAVLDYKQSNKLKKEEWVNDYKLQLTAYIMAHNKLYGTDIKTGVILMCTADMVFQNFILTPDSYNYWEDQWLTRLEDFYSKNK
jgi:ATP-dependent exoDNAse (exonuclease V) beta subunit